MSQPTTWGVPSVGPANPTEMAGRMNDSLDALLSGHKGTGRPAYAVAGMKWVKEVSSTAEELYFYDGTEDVLVGTYNPAAHTWTPAGVGRDTISMVAKALNLAKGGNVASAATTNIWAADGNSLHVTGTTTITSLGTAPQAGAKRTVVFDGSLTLTNGANLILPGGANITTAASDSMVVLAETTTQHRVVSYTRASGAPVAGAVGSSFQNKLINGDFRINQRAVSGTVTLAAGAYGHDRWKAGASGCTYTFATSNGVTTLTITAGSLQQVVEGSNLRSGTVSLSWVGTAQGKIGAGSYAESGVTGTATGGANLTVEFGTGTLADVQLEDGSAASAFERRPLGVELALCERYYYRLYTDGRALVGLCNGTTQGDVLIFFPVEMRTAPTSLEVTGAATDYGIANTSGTINCNAVPVFGPGSQNTRCAYLRFQVASGLTNGHACFGRGNNANAYFGFNAEL